MKNLGLYEQLMNEWSLSRAYAEFMGGGLGSFAIVSAFRGDRSHQENMKNTGQLKDMARSAGRGYTSLDGYGQEQGGSSVSEETSLWINGISFNDAQRLASTFDQEYFIYAGPETKSVVTAFSGSGSVVREFTHFSPMAVAEFYSVWRGRPFHFERASPNVAGGWANMADRKDLREFIDWLEHWKP